MGTTTVMGDPPTVVTMETGVGPTHLPQLQGQWEWGQD